jgi:acetyltransferase-like isoleucine patch superfamily enzyme
VPSLAPTPGPQKLGRARLARDRYLIWTHLVNLVCRALGNDRLSWRLRRWVLTRYGWRLGAGTQIDGLRYAYGTVQMGTGCYVNRECYFEGEAPITIGDQVGIGPNVTFLTVGHRIGPPTRRTGEFDIRPITVGDGAWIGAGVTILPGVRIGAGAVVAAGAVVTEDVPPNTLVAGVPARVKRTLDED